MYRGLCLEKAGLEGGLEAGLEGGLEAGLEGGLEAGLEGGLEAGLEGGFTVGLIVGLKEDSGVGFKNELEVEVKFNLRGSLGCHKPTGPSDGKDSRTFEISATYIQERLRGLEVVYLVIRICPKYPMPRLKSTELKTRIR